MIETDNQVVLCYEELVIIDKYGDLSILKEFKIEAGAFGINAFSDDAELRAKLGKIANAAFEKHDREINPDDYDDE